MLTRRRPNTPADLALAKLRPRIAKMAHLRYPARHWDDAISVGMMAAWLAWERGERRAGYLLGKASWAMKDRARAERPGRRRRPVHQMSLSELEVPVEDGGLGDSFEPMSKEPPADEKLEALRKAVALKLAISELPPRHRLVIEERLSGQKMKAIAKKLGVTQPRATQILGAVKRKLRERSAA